jgi:hypothetical protein
VGERGGDAHHDESRESECNSSGERGDGGARPQISRLRKRNGVEPLRPLLAPNPNLHVPRPNLVDVLPVSAPQYYINSVAW